MQFNIEFVMILFSAVFVGTASGIMSSLLVLRRMTLISDALSHVALPGIALGLLFKFQPLLGGLLFLFVGVLLIWQIEFQTKLATESLTGVIFTASLAAGALLTPEPDLLEAFFGNISKPTTGQAILESGIAIGIIIIATLYLKQMVLFSIAPDLAASVKLSKNRIELLLLMLIALTITIGISFVGVLLMSALLILPGVTARQLARSFRNFVIASILLAVTGLIGGILLSTGLQIQSGITTVLLSFSFFVLSLIFYKFRETVPSA